MQGPVQLRLNVLVRASLFVHGLRFFLVAVPHLSLLFGLVPPALPPSHAAQPRLHPTDIHRHVWATSHVGWDPLRQAHALSGEPPSL